MWHRSRLHDVKVERMPPPMVMNGHEMLEQLAQFEFSVISKHPSLKDKKRNRAPNWTKRNIFFELPYWSRLLLCHKLDVMLIDKNVCDNLVGTLLNIEGKTKDDTIARLDLQDLKIRKNLHLIEVVLHDVCMKEKGKYQVSIRTTIIFYYIDCYLLNDKSKWFGQITSIYHNHYLQVGKNISTFLLQRYVCLEQSIHEESIVEAYVMNELDTFSLRYLSGIETQFTRDERNDDTISDDEAWVDPKIVERSVVRHVVDDFIDDGDEQLSHQIESSDDE
ncbi:uncharacterized protein E6C27_scaffold34G001730 [Cucumis melo var. makuwa]|uniref:Uncharacterized protein n=1 Tax=Cucumis melo var. makuwa TaxID=1194695 RepID=A0A5A7SJA9_CUCMM|nr:uncharacterized protein E6C27_scaffold34G001730 [Cucumis melo var. makuwa]